MDDESPGDLIARFSAATPNALARALEERARRGAGAPLDLTAAVPSRVGLAIAPELVAEAYAAALAGAARHYDPDPLGRHELREAIAAWYARAGVAVSPDRVVVTPGTSLAYLYLFRLLARPGDSILRPRPGYPLFDDIAACAHVALADYPLREGERWAIDLDGLEARTTERTRSVCVVTPHNPTGAIVGDADLAALGGIAARHDLALIVDEVFSEFRFGAAAAIPLPRPRSADGAPLWFLLNGLSKMLGLPGHKVGWIVVGGADDARVTASVRALEHLSDTFLPVSDVAQLAAARLLRDAAGGGDVAREIARLADALAQRRDALLAALGLVPGAPATACCLDAVPPAGGTYLSLRLTAPGVDEEAAALAALDRADLVVHPGYYYHLAPDHLVMTFLREPVELARAAALGRIVRDLAAPHGP